MWSFISLGISFGTSVYECLIQWFKETEGEKKERTKWEQVYCWLVIAIKAQGSVWWASAGRVSVLAVAVWTPLGRLAFILDLNWVMERPLQSVKLGKRQRCVPRDWKERRRSIFSRNTKLSLPRSCFVDLEERGRCLNDTFGYLWVVWNRQAFRVQIASLPLLWASQRKMNEQLCLSLGVKKEICSKV